MLLMMDTSLPSAFKQTGQDSIGDATFNNATYRSSVTAPAGDDDLEHDGRDKQRLVVFRERQAEKKKD